MTGHILLNVLRITNVDLILLIVLAWQTPNLIQRPVQISMPSKIIPSLSQEDLLSPTYLFSHSILHKCLLYLLYTYHSKLHFFLLYGCLISQVYETSRQRLHLSM